MNQYKEFSNQNYIELRFSNKNARELSQDEAMIRYKRNNYILGRIFSYDIDSDGYSEAVSFDPHTLKNVSEEYVETVQKELEEIKERHRESFEEFKIKQQQFKRYLEQAHHFKDNEGMDDFIQELMDKQLLNIDHPFFKKNSPFYLQTDNKFVKEVILLEHKNAHRETVDETQFAIFE
ncbi:hypothetical protein ABPG72_014563 [Tetrahymena utriculariae]